MRGFEKEPFLVGNCGIGECTSCVGEANNVVVLDGEHDRGGDLGKSGFGILCLLGTGIEMEGECAWDKVEECAVGLGFGVGGVVEDDLGDEVAIRRVGSNDCNDLIVEWDGAGGFLGGGGDAVEAGREDSTDAAVGEQWEGRNIVVGRLMLELSAQFVVELVSNELEGFAVVFVAQDEVWRDINEADEGGGISVDDAGANVAEVDP